MVPCWGEKKTTNKHGPVHMPLIFCGCLTFVFFFCFFFKATAEPGDEEAVTRAKYFIRDEFLVSTIMLVYLLASLSLQQRYKTLR